MPEEVSDQLEVLPLQSVNVPDCGVLLQPILIVPPAQLGGVEFGFQKQKLMSTAPLQQIWVDRLVV
jgi:hypothetical protein